MLSGETANGKHPSLVVKTMAAIVANAELAVDYQEQYHVIRYGVTPPPPGKVQCVW
jgi:pyruvate kinase